MFSLNVSAEENNNYITAEDLIGNEYIQNLVASLPFTCDDTTDRYFQVNLGDPYQTVNGERFYIAIIMENISDVVYTPNGTSVNDPTIDGSLRLVGIVDTSEAHSILDRLNNVEFEEISK